MKRHGFAPSNDDRWEVIAQDTIDRAEKEQVPLVEFYRGLAAIMDSLDARLEVGGDECADE